MNGIPIEMHVFSGAEATPVCLRGLSPATIGDCATHGSQVFQNGSMMELTASCISPICLHDTSTAWQSADGTVVQGGIGHRIILAADDLKLNDFSGACIAVSFIDKKTRLQSQAGFRKWLTLPIRS